jgi:hypothetical protein
MGSIHISLVLVFIEGPVEWPPLTRAMHRGVRYARASMSMIVNINVFDDALSGPKLINVNIWIQLDILPCSGALRKLLISTC